MSPGTNAQEFPGTRAAVFLNEDRFDLITNALGAKSEQAKADLLGVDPKTVYRARRGPVGEAFIAAALRVMCERRADMRPLGIKPTFEAMFELGERVAA